MHLTTIGLDYLKYQESKRSNLANEQETNRANVARETETYRANKAREDETYRSNIENERMKQFSLDEDARHNRAVEGENYRSNVARENETNRHNTETETQGWISNMGTGARAAASSRHLGYGKAYSAVQGLGALSEGLFSSAARLLRYK